MTNELTKHECFTIIILVYINVINYMDRYTVAAILGEIQEEFDFTDDYAGLLQTVFIVSYTISAPIFGYFGDRYSRRAILAFSVFLWSAGTLAGSFTTTYGWFFFMRSFVGAGEASFSTIAPTVIYDVTYKKIRKTVLGIFYTAIPVGVSLGFITAATAVSIAGHWSWGMRVTPVLAAVGIFFMFFTKDPVRGERERLDVGKGLITRKSTYKKDLKRLSKNRSYLLSTFGFTCMTFVIGAVSWWAPTYFHSGFRLLPGKEDLTLSEVTTALAPAGVLSGLIGVPLGSFISSMLIQRYSQCDPIICCLALLVGDPFLITGLIFADESVPITYVTTTIALILMNFTWTIVADILLSCVVPESRSTAEAFQIVFIHTFGDAGSPYVVGLISEYLKSRWRPNDSVYPEDLKLVHQFKSLRNGLLCTTCLQVIGGGLFFANAFYIDADRKTVLEAIASSARSSAGD